jgi:hypothetical protein
LRKLLSRVEFISNWLCLCRVWETSLEDWGWMHGRGSGTRALEDQAHISCTVSSSFLWHACVHWGRGRPRGYIP